MATHLHRLLLLFLPFGPPPLRPRHAAVAAFQRRPVPCRAAAGQHLQPVRGAPHGRVQAAAGVSAVRRRQRGRRPRPVVPPVEERHGHGRPRRRAVHRRPVPRRLRPCRPRLPQRAGRGDPRPRLRLHRRLPRRHRSQQRPLHGEARRGAAAGRVPRRRDAVRRAVRLPSSTRRAGAAVPRLRAVHPAVPGARGAREQGERGEARGHRVAQPGRLLRAGVPAPDPAAVAPEVRPALRHGVHGPRRVPAPDAEPRLRARRRARSPRRARGAAVADGVRRQRRHAAAGRHAGQELHGERHVGVFDGDRGTLYETRALPVQLGFRAPVVPTTCINGVGGSTMEQLVYWDGNFSETQQVVYGDGDGVLPLASILDLDMVIGGDPRQKYYRSIKLAGTSHAGVVSDAAAVKHIVDEILWSAAAVSV